MTQRIKCSTTADFYGVIADLVTRGIGFVADYDTLTIALTGAI